VGNKRMNGSWVAGLACVMLAAGCGGGGGGGGGGAVFVPPSTTVSGQATAGLVNNGTVEVYSVNTQSRQLSLSGSGTSSATGQFSVALTGSGPFLVLVRGGTFTDEATGNTATLGSPAQPTSLDDDRSNTLEGVIAAGLNGNITINLSPLTGFASRRIAEQLRSNGAAYDSANVNAVNQSIGMEFGLGSGIDPRNVLPVDFTNAGNAGFIANNPNDPGVLLGGVLAGLSQAAVDLGIANPMDFVEALARDFTDGLFNGSAASGTAGTGTGIALGNGFLPQNAGTTQVSMSATSFLDTNPNNNSTTNSTANSGLVTSLGTLDTTPGGNTAPFFNGITAQTVITNTPPTNVPVTGISPGSPTTESAQTVMFIAVSSDTNVLPNPTITGSGASRTLVLSPGAIGGVVSVTITAMDDGGQASNGVDSFTRTVQITVFAPNQAPSFDTIAPQTVLEDSTNNTATLSNLTPVETGQTITTVTATSSDPTIVPNPTVTGSGATRTLTYSPVPDAFGQVTITVTAQDDGGTANGGMDTFMRTFSIDVTSVNDAPAFATIANQNVLMGTTSPQTVSITAVSGGPANESQTVAFTATSISTANIPDPVITGSGASRTLTYTPQANAMGTVTIDVTAMDPDGTANQGVDTLQRSFTITIVQPLGNATVSGVVPDAASSAGGTTVRVSTTMFLEDFTVTAPTATVGGMTAIVVAVDATTADVTIPAGLTVGNQTIQLMTGTDVAMFATFQVLTPIAMGNVIINEVLANPSGGDSSGDGNNNSSDNEFVELVNTLSTPVDLTGSQLLDQMASAVLRHTFPNPTVIPANGGIVIFGKVDLTMTTFPAAQLNGTAQAASSGGLSLNNSNDGVTFRDIGGNTIDTISYTTTPIAESVNVPTDGIKGALVLHSTVPGAIVQPNLGKYTPGVKVDGTPHAAPAPMPMITTVVPPLADVAGGTIITVNASNFSFLTNGPNTVTLGGLTVSPGSVTANSFNFTVPSGLSVGNNQTLSVMNTAGTATFTMFNVVASVVQNDLVINEVLAFLTQSNVDANGDGTMSNTQDEFVELVNVLTTPVDISGFVLTDSMNTVHVFNNPTTIPAGGSIVVFGGGNPANFVGFAAAHMNGAAQASVTGLALTNAGDTVSLIDPANVNTPVATVTYNTGVEGVSLNLTTEADRTTMLVNHNTVTGANGNFSPGFKVDGTTLHSGLPPPPTATPLPTLGRVSGGTTIGVTATNLADFTQSAPTVMLGAVDLSAMLTNVSATSFTFAVPATLSVGNVTLSVMNSGGTATFTTFAIVANGAIGDLIVNEFMSDPNGGTVIGTFDSNGDGVPSSTQDEFVELVNKLNTPIDISGYRVSDGASVRHTFPNPTTIPAGGSIVVFGGGTPTGFPAAHLSGAAQTAGSLGFGNTNDMITVDNEVGAAAAVQITQLIYNNGPDGNSGNRATDGDGTALIVDHTTIAPGATRASPGTKIDGTSFP
jgi:hypothetical protein